MISNEMEDEIFEEIILKVTLGVEFEQVCPLCNRFTIYGQYDYNGLCYMRTTNPNISRKVYESSEFITYYRGVRENYRRNKERSGSKKKFGIRGNNIDQ